MNNKPLSFENISIDVGDSYPSFILEQLADFICTNHEILVSYNEKLVISEDFGSVFGFTLSKLETLVSISLLEKLDASLVIFNPNLSFGFGQMTKKYLSKFKGNCIEQIPFYVYVVCYCEIISEFTSFSDSEMACLQLIQSTVLFKLKMPKIFDKNTVRERIHELDSILAGDSIDPVIQESLDILDFLRMSIQDDNNWQEEFEDEDTLQMYKTTLDTFSDVHEVLLKLHSILIDRIIDRIFLTLRSQALEKLFEKS